MSAMLILLPTLLLYIGALYWLVTKVNLGSIWRGENIELVQSIDKPLLNLTKNTLDSFMVMLTIICVVILPVTVVLGLSQGGNANWGVDINIFAGFSLNLNNIADIGVTGLRHPEISGKSIISIDTSNTFAFYLFMFSQGALAIAGLYGVIQLRNIVISLKKGNAFCQDNASRLKRIGLLVMLWNFLSPFFQYFAWGYVINDINFTHEGIKLFPAFEFDLMAIFIGAMMIILSDLFLDATTLTQENRLTI